MVGALPVALCKLETMQGTVLRIARAVMASAMVVSLLLAFGGIGSPQAVASSSGSAGTNIGNAKQLTGTASGRLTSAISDDWYAVYPKTRGGTVKVEVKDTTTNGATSCEDLAVSFLNTNGDAVANAGLVPNSSYDQPFSAPDSDRYFIELTTDNCTPPPDQPVTYKLTLQSGGGGKAPRPRKGSAQAGDSIGNAWPPLKGNTSYTGSIANGIADEWYVLYKHPGTNSATVRIENTTVKSSTDCTNLDVVLHDTDGNSLNNADLAENTATTFIIANGGRYYLELTDGNCVDGGTTYRIEPQPANQFDSPTKLPVESLPVGPSMAKAGGPLAGGLTYTHSITGGSVQLWSEFDDNGSVPHVTASVQNTTNDQSNCPDLTAVLYNSKGNAIDNASLARDTGREFTVDTKGKFYLELTDLECNPGGTPPTKVGVTITPAKGVTGPSVKSGLQLAEEIIKQFEGFRSKPYNDAAGHCTIGYGTKLSNGPCTAAIREKYGSGITKTQASKLLEQALAKFDRLLKAKVKVALTSNQRGALDSFIYNVGPDAFAGSTLLRLLNQGRLTAAANQLPRWVHVDGGKVLKGLKRRRAEERNLFLYGTRPPSSAGSVLALGISRGVSRHANSPKASVSVSASPSTVVAGRSVRISGSGWGGKPSCGSVAIGAEVLGVSPYVASSIPAKGTPPKLEATWSTSKGIVDTLPWRIVASQTCGSSRRLASTSVTVKSAG